MSKKIKSIPVHSRMDDFNAGIDIEKISIKDLHTLDKATLSVYEEAVQSHRENHHSFFLLESGTIHIEIDFQKYKVKPLSIIYMHPSQVHRILAFENVIVSSWAINNENLNPEYLKLLESITPVKPLQLKREAFLIISEAVSLCVKFSERKNDKLYYSLLRDGCNALIALAASQYLEQSRSTDKLSRFEIVTKAFKEILERNFRTVKRPTAYARKLNISTAYLNECVKNATGYSVSHHIQQRVVLEAKRLLYHSDQSVKEIAVELGYADYPYFSRMFTKVTGMSALTFRNKNLE